MIFGEKFSKEQQDFGTEIMDSIKGHIESICNKYNYDEIKFEIIYRDGHCTLLTFFPDKSKK